MKAFLTIMSMLLVQTAAMANNRISGVLVDDSDSSPLVGATVVLSDGSDRQVMGTTTDTEGRFELKGAPEGDYLLQCMWDMINTHSHLNRWSRMWIWERSG